MMDSSGRTAGNSSGMDLYQFMRDRAIPEATIERMRKEKIDAKTVLLIDDKQLQAFLPHLGDRVAVQHFCKKTMKQSSSSDSEDTEKGKLLQKLRMKLHNKRGGGTSEAPKVHLVGNKHAKRTTRKIDIGWMHYDEVQKQYKQVRKQHGGGTRKLAVSKSSTADTLKKIAEGLFFKDGQSSKGSLESHETQLTDVRHQVVPSSATLEELFEEAKMAVVRFYLKTKQYGVESEDEESFDLWDPPEVEVETSKIPVDQHSDMEASTSFEQTDTPTILFRHRHQECNEHVPSTDSAGSYQSYIEILDSDIDEEDQSLAAAIEASLNDIQPLPEPRTEKTLHQIISQLEQSITGDPIMVIASRKRLLKSAIHATQAQGFSFDRPPCVTFAGEEAEDEGGPSREFFKLLMKGVACMGIFDSSKGGLQFRYDVEHMRKGTYKTAGQLIRWSLSNGGPGLNGLNPCVFEAMVGKADVSLSEVDNICDTAYRANVKKLQDCSASQMTATIEELTDWLIDQGVTKFIGVEKEDIVQSLLNHYMVYRVQPATSQFISGLGEDLFHDIEQNQHTTRCLLVQHDISLTPKSLKELYQVEYSPEGSNNKSAEDDTIYSFEVFIENCSRQPGTGQVKLTQLLDFWTGADCIPPCGFKKRLMVGFYTAVTGVRRLPSAYTCGPTLSLPRGVDDPDAFHRMMEDAILNCQGFGRV
ncbi:uncharacterized protein LOC119729371 [Patiria miniata]|uniref:HECT-type E3 ubiquitin transferase n=1 Tax=Patiria miniata TaxID=46514 RepID=A0A914A3G7_PATMI|nr:uncharacterized protein LOC119729371 [Patiria miniata]